MHESFLHYVWQFQYFNKKELKTTEGEELIVLSQGILNNDAGPDFGNARVQIEGMAWAGTIEIHVKASEWNAHKHQSDRAYDNVVLHVVWQNDKPVYRSDGSALPTMELKSRVDESLLLSYRKLVESGLSIPCAKSIAQVPDIVKLSMLERSVLHRLEKKAKVVIDLLSANKGDWEETTYQVIAANFGFKVNSEPFSLLAKSTPYKIILKQASQLLQVEALLFGQAGLLEKDIKDEHVLTLKREYKVLASKYRLEALKLKASQWRFLRLRPANFPTLRIAQFASLLVHQPNLFSKIKETGNPVDLQNLFPTHTGTYWQTHYRFGMPAKGAVPDLGSASRENIIINSIAPLLVAYGREHNEQVYIDRALETLQALPVEKNRILKAWTNLGWKVSNGFDSQGLIELYNSFCATRQCLNCAIGSALIKPR
jgi:hypothetical protein